MSEWTETARRALEAYCARSRVALAGTGADANEVIEDLRRHVEEELRHAKLSVVTEEDVRRILARVGEPQAARENQPSATHATAPSGRPAALEKVRPGWFVFVLGVVLPVATLFFELISGMSAGVLFDPLPSWLHVALVALVPAANFFVWRAARQKDPRHARLLGWLNGVAFGIASFYALLYLPFSPFAAFGLIWFGLGLIPLAPLIAVAVTPWLRAVYRERTACAHIPGAWGGFVAGFVLLVLLQLPAALTHYGLAKATDEVDAVRHRGIRVLRTFGDEEMLLRACYRSLIREADFDLVAQLAGGKRWINPEEAREIYYRVTGRPFNSVAAPSLYTQFGRWTALENEFTWDDALGGEAVAGRVKGLSLLSSRMDAITEPDAALTYCEWTMEFKNVSSQAREARAQIALPPGGVVSRLTLWVNGEEREAAFGGRAQARQAYQSVAVVQRRDPVLVTTCGPDRVLMQCFPVPADGGLMKVRLGITAPLALESPERGRFVWPRYLERNFRIGDEFKHALWIESPMPLTSSDPTATTLRSATNTFSVRLSPSEISLFNSPAHVVVQRSAEAETVVTAADANGRVIRQTIRAATVNPPGRVVFVFDGSAGLRAHAADIAAGLGDLPTETEVAALVAELEGVTVLLPPQKASASVLGDLRQRFRRVNFAGGQDNLPALEAGWDLAAASENGVLIWIHAPQPVLLSNGDGLRQRFDRSATPPRFLELPVATGPDRIVEKLDGLPVDHVPRWGALREDLAELIAQLAGKQARFTFVREQASAASGTVSGTPASKHIERLWARDEVRHLTKTRQREEATKLAAKEQLVTPVTGAVVLETMQQFAQHGLTPVDASTVPVVPEPGTWALLGLGLAVMGFNLWLKRRRKI
jgi:hypothetical protein